MWKEIKEKICLNEQPVSGADVRSLETKEPLDESHADLWTLIEVFTGDRYRILFNTPVENFYGVFIRCKKYYIPQNLSKNNLLQYQINISHLFWVLHTFPNSRVHRLMTLSVKRTIL